MSTREALRSRFSNGNFADAAAFADLINSLKVVQSAVSDPAAAGTSVTFIATITQDADGKITVTKKTVNFSGYQTVAGMSDYQTVAGMNDYQSNDLQQVDDITNGPGEPQTITHEMKHYPTVRLINSEGVEMDARDYIVKHIDEGSLTITLGESLTDSYRYILD